MTTTGKEVVLSTFVLAAIGQRQADPAAELSLAVTFYLADRGANRPGWPYPGSLLPEAQSEGTVTVGLDPQLWDQLAAEAERQGVAVDLLATHAAIYFAAEIDAGRVTERILADRDS